MARPMPRLEPVTNTVLSVIRHAFQDGGSVVRLEHVQRGRGDLRAVDLNPAVELPNPVVRLKRAVNDHPQHLADAKACPRTGVAARAQHEPDARLLAAQTGAPAGPGCNRLRHVLDSDPAAHAGGSTEEVLLVDSRFGHKALFVAFDGSSEQAHGSGVRNQSLNRVRDRCAHHPRPRTSTALLPPNAKELLMTYSKGRPSASPERTTWSAGRSGSVTPSHQCGGIRPSSFSCNVSQQNAASRAPAPPRAWPVSGLVELTGVPPPNSDTTALLSIASFAGVPVPWRLM